MASKKHSKGVTPLPSLIRASAWDAGNFHARDNGRKTWTRDDYNAAAECQERLVRACYGLKSDPEDSPLCFIRFQIAEQAEKAGQIDLDTDISWLVRACDEAMNRPFQMG